MDFKRTTVAQFEDILRLILLGRSDRQIALSERCRRTLIADIRKGTLTKEELERLKKVERLAPAWTSTLNWENVEKDIRDGHQIKRIWEESAAESTSHPNFFKYVKVRFAALLEATVTLREFKPGEYSEVDYAGKKIPWIDLNTGEIQYAHVFVGILCFSQKIFAHAAVDEKKVNWLISHRLMLEYFGGVPLVIVPDNLKTGVIKSHLYDPDLNPDYVELASHYSFSVVPARALHPKDKALVEGAVGILMRYFRFIYRRRTFTSVAEINVCLREAGEKINAKIHTRFKVSRQDRFERLERATLRCLPLEPYSVCHWKTAKHHQDCTVAADFNFYSAPHAYRGKELRVKMSATRVEIFFDLERIAVHARAIGKVGERIIEEQHLPENSRAYREATPQMLLAQARFSHQSLNLLVDELFQKDTCGNLRRAQGLVRKAYALINEHGRMKASPWIEGAVNQMRRFNRVRVKAFEGYIKDEMKKENRIGEDRTITRQSGNPMVRERVSGAPETQLKLV
jgi:hypothetical protein